MSDYVRAACAMVRVGGRFVTLGNGDPVPVGADPEHVELLRKRGIVAEGEPATGYVQPAGLQPPFVVPDNMHTDDDPDGPGGVPPKSANKDEWVAYAVTQGATQADAEAATKDDLIAAYGAK